MCGSFVRPKPAIRQSRCGRCNGATDNPAPFAVQAESALSGPGQLDLEQRRGPPSHDMLGTADGPWGATAASMHVLPCRQTLIIDG
jgi:hypothetical protein